MTEIVPTTQLIQIYKTCLNSRLLESHLTTLWNEHQTKVIFSGIGNEHIGSSLGVLQSSDDYLVPRYRGFASQLGKGLPVKQLIAELTFKASGTMHGIGGVTAYTNPTHNLVPHNINLGSMFSVAVGLAYALQQQEKTSVVAIHFGDGEASRTTFASAMNIASLWKLPILFVCESNQIADTMDMKNMSAASSTAAVAECYQIQNTTVQAVDVRDVLQKMYTTLGVVRSTHTPRLLTVSTTRYTPHFLWSTPHSTTQTIPTVDPDPITAIAALLIEQGVSKEEIQSLNGECTTLVADSIKTAKTDLSLSEEEFLKLYDQS